MENELLQTAQSNSLYAEELDVSQELPTDDSTLVGRYMFDPMDTTGGPTGRDVLDGLRYYMGQHGYSWTQVTFSVSGENNVDLAGYDCGSVYGDSARILPASELIAMYGGGEFGWPNTPGYHNLPRGGSIPSFQLEGPSNQPMSWTEPEILDIHTTMCLDSSGTTTCENPQPSQNATATEAQTTFSDIEAFLNSFCSSGWRHDSTEMCGALFMLGETDVYQPQPPPYQSMNCVPNSPVVVPAGNVQGFNFSTLAGRAINGSQPGVIFRPWTDPLWNALDSNGALCFGFPQALQPTFVPTP